MCVLAVKYFDDVVWQPKIETSYKRLFMLKSHFEWN